MTRRIRASAVFLTAIISSGFGHADSAASGQAGHHFSGGSFAENCTPTVVQSAADAASRIITITAINNHVTPNPLVGGARYFPATEQLPAFCQVSGQYVTNPKTGKTANFVATFPESWNGKFLQYGCFGTCGFVALNDAASPLVDIIAQGMPGDSIRKGYASIGTDEGHDSRESASWAVKSDGRVDQDAIDDFLYRATAILAKEGKALTQAFYSKAAGKNLSLDKSYFTGCSGGGRNALVAASYFADEFDGIIAGSPAADFAGLAFQDAAINKARKRLPGSTFSPEQIALLNERINQKCDLLDGLEDGLIQNPAACDFIPERDLPQCDGASSGNQCFTQEQVQTLSVYVNAVTDESGRLVQPGFSISNLDSPGLAGKLNDIPRVFAYENATNFDLEAVIDLKVQDGPGGKLFRAVVPSDVEAKVSAVLDQGGGLDASRYDPLVKGTTKLMIWHDLSDQALTPYMSINLYKELAARHGGYESLQEKVRLLTLPGTRHCSGGIGGVGPNSVDVLTAMEKWVENGEAPDGAVATYYPGTAIGGKDFTAAPGRTMPLCSFPAQARYSGKGAVDDASNWRCDNSTQPLLQVGESGRRAGVIE